MPASPHIDSNEIVITIITGTILFLMLVSFSIAFLLTYQKRKKEYRQEKEQMKILFQQEILKSQLETQEHTFNQISQELHDNIGQLLSSTKMLLNIAGKELEQTPETLKTAEQTVGKAIQDVRSLSKSLNKEWLHQFNLIDNLKAEQERINAGRNIEVMLASDFENLPLEPTAQVMLFRVMQEAIQNSIKHAHAKNIVIEIKNTQGFFKVNIEDDGIGFKKENVQKGLGLMNMEHRTKLLGGTIAWTKNKKDGTTINMNIPKLL